MKKVLTIIAILLLCSLTAFFAFKYYQEVDKEKDTPKNEVKKEEVLNLTVAEINKKVEELGIKKLQNKIEYLNASNKFRTNVNLFENYELKNRILLTYNKNIEKVYRENDNYTEDVLVDKETFKTEFQKMWNETINEKTHKFDGNLVKCYEEETGLGIPNFDIKAKSFNYNEANKEYTINFYISEELTDERDANNQYIYRYSTKYTAQLKFKYENKNLQLISYMIVEE